MLLLKLLRRNLVRRVVKISFKCKLADKTITGSFITDNENGNSFILSKHKEEIINDVINKSLEITDYSYEIIVV